MTKSWQHRHHSRRQAALAEGPYMLTTEAQNLDEALDILARQPKGPNKSRKRGCVTIQSLLALDAARRATVEKRRMALSEMPAAPFAWATEDEARALARSMYSERGIKPGEITRRLGQRRGITMAKVLAWLDDLLPEWQKARVAHASNKKGA